MATSSQNLGCYLGKDFLLHPHFHPHPSIDQNLSSHMRAIAEIIIVIVIILRRIIISQLNSLTITSIKLILMLQFEN